MNLLKKFVKNKAINPPGWLVDNTMYLTMHGSYAYQVNSNNSDVDIYGIVIPLSQNYFLLVRLLDLVSLSIPNRDLDIFKSIMC